MDASTPIIQVHNLSYAVGKRTILEGVSFDVYPGEIFAVMGLSGTGKTTLLRLLSGLIRPTDGSIVLLGEEMRGMPEGDLNRMRAQMGFVFQYGALFDSLTVQQNVGFYLYEHTNLPAAKIRATVGEKLKEVGMAGTEDLFPAEISGGMQKRVGIARALVGDPALLLYDEPTSGLDPVIAATIDELIVHLRKTLGVTEIIVSHDVRSVMRMADRVALLYEQRLHFIGTAEAFRVSSDPVVRQFLEGRTDGPIQVV